jgi:hypothetical protein
MNYAHAYFIQHLFNLDNRFKYQNSETALQEYISSLRVDRFIDFPLVSLMIQSENMVVQESICQPIHEILNYDFLKQYIIEDHKEVRFVMSFTQESDYSSHVRIVGTITPFFTYQVMVEELNEFEINYLFTLQLMILTYWEATAFGKHPWVSLIKG